MCIFFNLFVCAPGHSCGMQIFDLCCSVQGSKFLIRDQAQTPALGGTESASWSLRRSQHAACIGWPLIAHFQKFIPLLRVSASFFGEIIIRCVAGPHFTIPASSTVGDLSLPLSISGNVMSRWPCFLSQRGPMQGQGCRSPGAHVHLSRS